MKECTVVKGFLTSLQPSNLISVLLVRGPIKPCCDGQFIISYNFDNDQFFIISMIQSSSLDFLFIVPFMVNFNLFLLILNRLFGNWKANLCTSVLYMQLLVINSLRIIFIILVPPREFLIKQNEVSEEGYLYTLHCIANSVKPVPRIWWEMRSTYLFCSHYRSKNVRCVSLTFCFFVF